MRPVDCIREEAIRRAAARGGLNEDLEGHAAGCVRCGESLRVGRWLKGLSERDAAVRLPDVRELWWRSRILRQLFERDVGTRRALRPAAWGQALGLGSVGVVLSVLVVSLATDLTELAGRYGELHLDATVGGSWLLVVLTAGLTTLAALAGLLVILRES